MMFKQAPWLVLLVSSCLLVVSPNPVMAEKKHRLELEGIKTVSSETKTKITFINRSTKTVKVFWLDSNGKRQLYNTIKPGLYYVQDTFVGHPWLTTDENDNAWEVYIAKPQSDTAMLVVIQGEPKVSVTTPPMIRLGSPPALRIDNAPTVPMLKPSDVAPTVESTKDQINTVKKQILDIRATLRAAERQDESNQAENDRIVQKRQRSIDDRDARATELLGQGKYVQAAFVQSLVESDRRDLYKGLALTNTAEFFRSQLLAAEKKLIDLENQN